MDRIVRAVGTRVGVVVAAAVAAVFAESALLQSQDTGMHFGAAVVTYYVPVAEAEDAAEDAAAAIALAPAEITGNGKPTEVRTGVEIVGEEPATVVASKGVRATETTLPTAGLTVTAAVQERTVVAATVLEIIVAAAAIAQHAGRVTAGKSYIHQEHVAERAKNSSPQSCQVICNHFRVQAVSHCVARQHNSYRDLCDS